MRKTLKNTGIQMLRIDIITLEQELIEAPLSHSIVGRAREMKLAEINIINLRNYGIGNYKQVDDYQFGGGAGMVLMPEPLGKCLDDIISDHQPDEIIFLTPDGQLLNQKMANSLSLKGHMVFICGHYKGIDQRIRDKYVTKEISIGDYVLSGGEIAAAVLADAVIRLIPGVLGNEESALTDTFQDDLLAPPLYTRPQVYQGMSVPDVLLSGNHKDIEEWRYDKALEKTKLLRPDLMRDISNKQNN